MNRVATLSEKERNELFTLTSEQRGMGTIAVVEKDFWVCWTLKQLFEHPKLSTQLIFKGGTSLSKVYGLAADKTLKASALGKLELLKDVVLFKKKFYPRGWANYDAAVRGSLKLIPPDHVLKAMQKDYVAMQEMIFGRRPSFEEIITSLTELEREINEPKDSNDEC